MANFNVSDSVLGAANEVREMTDKYLGDFPGDLVCALQLWYEGFGGKGVPTKVETEVMEAALGSASGWKDVGGVRFEKYGVQHSFKRT